MRVALSNMQYTMLRSFATERQHHRMSIAEAAQFRQDTFRSMLTRGYIEYDPNPNAQGKSGFHITDKGKEEYRVFETTDILRRISSLQLTSYFQMPRLVKRAKAG
jgi:hypothetical protein